MISSPRNFILGGYSEEAVDHFEDYAQKLLSNIEGFLEADICSLRKAETTRANKFCHGTGLTWLHFHNSRGI